MKRYCYSCNKGCGCCLGNEYDIIEILKQRDLDQNDRLDLWEVDENDVIVRQVGYLDAAGWHLNEEEEQ